MRIVQGSVEPPIEVDLSDGLDRPVDLSAAVSVWVRGELNGMELFKRQVSGPGATTGIVGFEWQPGDTDTPGRLWIDVAVYWPNGRLQWFRSLAVVDIEALN